MPNLIYVTTHEALSALVSTRAATRCLDNALANSGQDPDTVTVRVMRRLLAGPIRRELSSALPRQGLTRSLKGIASALSKLEPSAATTIIDVPVDGLSFDAVSAASAQVATESATSAGSATTVGAPDQGVFSTGGDSFGDKRGEATTSPATVVPTPLLALDDEHITSALHLFGEQEAVQQVVILRGPDVLLSRGSMIATDRLPNLVRSTRHLLERVGRLRAFALERSSGVLFVFPVGSDSIVVVTEPDVNIGAVLTARAALEEAA